MEANQEEIANLIQQLQSLPVANQVQLSSVRSPSTEGSTPTVKGRHDHRPTNVG